MCVEDCYSETGSGLFLTIVILQPGADQNMRVNHNFMPLVLRMHQVGDWEPGCKLHSDGRQP